MTDFVFPPDKCIPPSEIRFVRKLAKGGVSLVWLVEHEAIPAPFVLKYSQVPVDNNPYLGGQFEREFQASRSLCMAGFPDISPKIFDYSIDNRHHAYLLMEYFPSRSLSQLMRNDLPWDESKILLKKVMPIIADIHRAQIIHRDIKPGNILFGVDGSVKVIDFSLSVIQGQWHPGHEEGIAHGTPSYLSPEQAFGKKEMLTYAADWYSLGVIIYEWMTGHLPFEGKEVRETLRMHCFNPPPQPVCRDGLTVPDELIDACLGLLEKDPELRYPAIHQLENLLFE